MLLHFDATLIVIAISFIIFAYIMHHIFYVPMRVIMEERDTFIDGNLNEAKRLTDKSLEHVADYQGKIKKALKTAQDRMEVHSETTKKEKSTIIGEASKEAQVEITSARDTLSKEKDSAIDELKGSVSPLAQQIVSKILGSEVSISGIDNEKVDKIMRG